MAVDPQETLRHLRRLASERRRRADERARRHRERLAEAAELLRRHGAGRVMLFGSLASGTSRPGSDVDLAVERLPPSAYFTALADLMALFRGSVDLVRIEEAPESLRERIRAEGIEL